MSSPFPLTRHLRNAIKRAQDVAHRRAAPAMEAGDLFDGLLEESGSLGAEILKTAGVTVGAPAANDIKKNLPLLPIDESARLIILRAATLAMEAHHYYLGTEHLLLALLESDNESLRAHLLNQKLNTKLIRRQLKNVIRSTTKFADLVAPFQENTAPTAAHTRAPAHPILDAVGHDLCNLARTQQIDPLIGRAAEVERIIDILARRTKNNPVLLGPPGVGKTAIVEGLAHRIATGNVPGILQPARIIALDMSALVAGTVYRGEFEARLNAIVDEVAHNPHIILFIDELHTVVGAGAAGGTLDAANILKPALARGRLRCIGATTHQDYKKIITTDPALQRRFQPVAIDEPTAATTTELLQGIRTRYEEFHHVTIPDATIARAIHLAERYLPQEFFPDKAIDLIDEAAARVSLHAHPTVPALNEIDTLEQVKLNAIKRLDFVQAQATREKIESLESRSKRRTQKVPAGTVTAEDIDQVVAHRVHLAPSALVAATQTDHNALENHLRQTIVGQDDAIDSVVRIIHRRWAGLVSHHRPVGSFLFLGPSGVGKTSLARNLAVALYGDERRCVRVDMSEISERFMTSRLIGSPPGYVGYREGGSLTEAVRQQPATVVLLDEIEKAHPDVLNLLLQILDEGRLTDAEGNAVDFRNTVLILTSNIGQNIYDRTLAFGFGNSAAEIMNRPAQHTAALLEVVHDLLPKELTNRLDRIIPFKHLLPKDLTNILTHEIADLNHRLVPQDIQVTILPAAQHWFVSHATIRDEGVRGLKRLVLEHVADPVARGLLEGIITRGARLNVSLLRDAPTLRPVSTNRRPRRA